MIRYVYISKVSNQIVLHNALYGNQPTKSDGEAIWDVKNTSVRYIAAGVNSED